MSNERIDARVIQILRWSIIVQIVFLLLSSFAPRFSFQQGYFNVDITDYLTFAFVAVMGLILIFISLKKVEERINKRNFLFILYAIALITIISRHLFSFSLRRIFPEAASFLLRWDAIFFLIIPLVFIAWQYSLKQVLVYCLIVLLADYTPVFFDQNRGNMIIIKAFSSGVGTSTGLDVRKVDLFFLIADFMGSFARSVILAIVGWIENSLVTLQRDQHNQLAQANKKLSKYALTSEKLAQTQERNRLARELHDTLAHTLSSTSVQLEAVKSLFDRNPEQAKILLNQTLQNTKSGLTETRRALVDLRSSELEAYGLTQSIQNRVNSAAERGGFSVEFHLDKGLDVLPDEISHALYRTVQESMENILRHANANRTTVSMLPEGNHIRLSIQDDGKGFDLNQIQKDQLGLRGMRERIEMLGGSFNIHSQTLQGTEINISIEVKDDQGSDL